MPPQKFQDVDLQPFIQRTKKLRAAFVLRKFHHVGYHANQIITDFIAAQPKFPLIRNITYYPYQHSFNEDELLDSGIVPPHTLFPWKPNFVSTDIDTTDRKFIPKTYLLDEEHPIMTCINYVLIAIQNVGYIPEQASIENEANYNITTSLQQRVGEPINDATQHAYIAYQISQFLCNIFGTWINVAPAIILNILQQFLTISPVNAVFIASTLLSQIDNTPSKNSDDLSASTTSYFERSTTRYAVRNIQYRRQIFVYFVQAFTLSLRLRIHFTYTDIALQQKMVSLHPAIWDIAEYTNTKDQCKQQLQSKFMNIYFDCHASQIHIIRQEMETFTLQGDEVPSKDPEARYIPTHIYQHLDSVLNVVDAHYDIHEAAPHILRLYVTGVTSLIPNQCTVVFSSKMAVQTVPKPEEKPAQPAGNKSNTTKLLNYDDLVEEARAFYESNPDGTDIDDDEADLQDQDDDEAYYTKAGNSALSALDMAITNHYTKQHEEEEEENPAKKIQQQDNQEQEQKIETNSTQDKQQQEEAEVPVEQVNDTQQTEQITSPITDSLEQQAQCETTVDESSYFTKLATFGLSAAAVSSLLFFFQYRK